MCSAINLAIHGTFRFSSDIPLKCSCSQLSPILAQQTRGLVHGNEDFLDEDTNSCMDYTYNYETHKGPNQRDFNVLRFLYGVFPNQNGQRRYLREETVNGVPQFESIADKVESWVEEEIRSLYDRQDGRRLQPRRWQRLNSDSHRETYEADLGRGYKLQIHGLLA